MTETTGEGTPAAALEGPSSALAEHILMLGDCPITVLSEQGRSAEAISPDIQWFWQLHPRITFVKGLALGAVILDFGAGNGSFFTSRVDYLPHRPDQKFYALDLFKGISFDDYDDYQVANFETNDLKWSDGSVDAVFACHLIEHLHDIRRFFDECWRVLRPGGLIYVETPSAVAEKLPDSGTIRAQGWPVVASNFFEDDTHVRALLNEEIAAQAKDHGFAVQTAGVVKSDYFSDALLTYAKLTGDQMFGMFGFWTKIGWAQYIVLRKSDAVDLYFNTLR